MCKFLQRPYNRIADKYETQNFVHTIMYKQVFVFQTLG